MPRTRAGLLSAYQRHLSLQRDLSQHTVRAYLVDVGDLLSFLGIRVPLTTALLGRWQDE